MAKMLVFEEPQKLSLQEYEPKSLVDGEVRIRTLFSGISTGTESTLFKGTNPFQFKSWSREQRLFSDRNPQDSFYPVNGGFGYEEVGEIVEIKGDAAGLHRGDTVYGAWGHRSDVTMTAIEAGKRILPEGLDPVSGIFGQIGAIAFNAVIDAQLILGEDVVISGLGVPGLICSKLCLLSGANVIAIDPIESRRLRAESLGVSHVIDPINQDAVQVVNKLTRNIGADVAIEFSGSYQALQDAIRMARYNGTVVVSGFYQENAHLISLGEEFHHNRIRLHCSQIFDVLPSVAYKWDFLRLEKTIMNLQLKGDLVLKDLITHMIPLDKSVVELPDLLSNPGDNLQAVMDFR